MKYDSEILRRHSCNVCKVLPNNQKGAFLKLVTLNTNPTDGPPSDEDIKIGIELFQTVVYCPTMVMKLFRFVDQLLSRESSKTIIHTLVNLFQSGAITDKTSFTLAKQFYFVLASTLNLQYGNVLLTTSTNAQLQAAIRNDFPFFANDSELVEECLHESHCDGVQDLLQRLGIEFFCYYWSIYLVNL